MSREADFATVMEADATLMAILTGGVHVSGEVGPEGISRHTTPSAFDSDGYLLPCALVRQRALVPDGIVRDGQAQHVSAAQVVEIWLYEDRGYSNIDSAIMRLFVLFEGVTVGGDAFPAALVNVLDRQRDEGALAGSSLARMDWAVNSIMGIGA